MAGLVIGKPKCFVVYIYVSQMKSGGIVVTTLASRSLGQWFNSHSEH